MEALSSIQVPLRSEFVTTVDIERIAGLVTLVGTGSCAATLVVLHLLPTGLSPLRDPVSQYGITRYRLGYRIQTVSMGIAAIALAIGVAKLDVQGCTLVVALFSLFGVARLAISWFPMDAPTAARTPTGRRHGLLALVAFSAGGIGAIRLGDILNRASVWGGTSAAALALGAIMVTSVIVMGALRRSATSGDYFGLAERGFYVAALAFLSVVGAQLTGAR